MVSNSAVVVLRFWSGFVHITTLQLAGSSVQLKYTAIYCSVAFKVGMYSCWCNLLPWLYEQHGVWCTDFIRQSYYPVQLLKQIKKQGHGTPVHGANAMQYTRCQSSSYRHRACETRTMTMGSSQAASCHCPLPNCTGDRGTHVNNTTMTDMTTKKPGIEPAMSSVLTIP